MLVHMVVVAILVDLQEEGSREVLQPYLVRADSLQGIFLRVVVQKRQHRQAYLLVEDSFA